MMSTTSHREIPYNYTSADDRQVVTSLVGRGVWQKLEALRERRVTGRSARLLLRVFGEVLVHRRNPYLRQELLDSLRRRERFFRDAESNLRVVQENLGHTSIKTTEIYLHTDLDERRKVYQEFFPLSENNAPPPSKPVKKEEEPEAGSQ